MADQTQIHFLNRRNAHNISFSLFYFFFFLLLFVITISLPLSAFKISSPHLPLHSHTFLHDPPPHSLLLSHFSTPILTNSTNLPFLHDSKTTKHPPESQTLHLTPPLHHHQHGTPQRAILAWGSPRRQGPCNPRVYQSFTATETPGNVFCSIHFIAFASTTTGARYPPPPTSVHLPRASGQWWSGARRTDGQRQAEEDTRCDR